MSSRAAQPLKRDLVLRFVPASLALHALVAAPWARFLAALLSLLGLRSGPVHWKDVDAPTVIPIDIDDLDDQVAFPPPGGTGPGGDGPGPRFAGDAGLDAELDGGVADAASDAMYDASDAETGEGVADAGPKRIRDPNALAGGLAAIKPPNKEVHVSVLVRTDHLRDHPIGKQLGSRLVRIEQWKPFFAGTGIDPVRDLDVVFAFGPRFYETSRVSVIAAHNKTDEFMSLALKTISDTAKGESIGDEEVLAFRAKIDGAERVIVQLPGGLIITPPDGEKQSIALARALYKKKKRVSDTLPKGDKDLIVSAFLTKPSNVLTAIPEDLHDVHITIRLLKDGGAQLDLDAKAKDEKHASDAVVTLKKLVDGYVPKGILGSLARKYVDGYSITSEGDVVRLHHELDGDRLDTVWTMLTTVGGL